MTSHLGARLRGASFCLAALALAPTGCDSDAKSRSIEITAPEKGAELNLEDDDVDQDKAGLQYDVEATSSRVTAGTTVVLMIDEESVEAAETTVEKDGSIFFAEVTLPPGTHTLQVKTAAGSVQSAPDHHYTFKALVIDSPTEAAVIGAAQDEDPAEDGIQIDVAVSAYGIDSSEDIALQVDGEVVGAAVHADDEGMAVFTGVTLDPGSHSLKAVAGKLESSVIRVSVRAAEETCPAVQFILPEAPASGGPLVLGGAGCPGSGSDFTIDVVVSTEAEEGAEVELKVNGASVQTAQVKGAAARFSDVVLNRRSTPNELSVVVQGPQGECDEVPFPAGIEVDCGGPDCTVTSPGPVMGVDANGDPALYLNAGSKGSNGFDFAIETDESALGNDVKLLIDGEERPALMAVPSSSKDGVRAMFAAVGLADGVHTIEALCADSAGNVTSSGEAIWFVDTVACGVAITSPAAGFDYVAADDTEGSGDGIQIDVTSTFTGSDCVQARAAACDPNTGITGLDFAAYSGASPLVSSVTLQSASSQTLCVEVEDRAGNVARGSVNVGYLFTPSVQIESPADGTTYNAMGNAGYTQTADPLSPVCAAEIVVLCSDLGTNVELRYALTDASPIAASPCEAPASGDPAIPAGFAGRARFPAVPFLPGAAETGTLVATQTVMGTVSNVVTATSAITLHGDCRPPNVVLTPDFCNAHQPIGVQLATDHVIRNIQVYDSTIDVDTVTLHVTNAGGAIDSTLTQSASAGYTTFTAVDLGNSNGSVSSATVAVTLTDDSANSIIQSCSIDIAFDLPGLSLTSPTNVQTFGINGGCNSGVAGTYGVPLAFTADKTTDRSAMVTVGAFGKAYGPPLASTAITDCVPAAEGTNTLQVDLVSSLSGAKITKSVSVTVDTFVVSAPTPNQAIGPAGTCSTGMVGETGITVTAALDPIHNGRSVTFRAGSNRIVTETVAGGAVSTCVPASLGGNTLTGTILDAGSNPLAMHTVAFSLVTVTPTHGIPITTVTLPPVATYRTGSITLAWTLPAEAYAGQLKTYALRCAGTPLDVDAGTQTDWDAWWTNATVVAVPGALVPPASSTRVEFRIGEVHHCVLRAADALGQLTPLVDSKQVDYPFRHHLVTPSSTGQRVGSSVAAIGDVDGDNLDDVLIGGQGEAQLVFGSRTSWATSSPDVVFQGNSASTLGWSVTGLGDFNGDGMDDFAISEPWWTNPNGALDYAGRVFVFYGRAARDWPPMIDLRGTCAADLCFENAQQDDSLGWAVAGVGDFNDDGRNDLAMGAVFYPALAGHGRVYVILGKAYEQGMAKAPGNKFWNLSVPIPGGAPLQGFVLSSDGTQAEQLGTAIVGVSNFDGLAGADLVISAVGFNAVTDRIFFLSGRPYALSTDTGLKTLTMADFGFISLGVPSGLPIDVAATQNAFGIVLSVLGNAYDVSGAATPGAIDIAVQVLGTDHIVLYPGDNGFSPADKVLVKGATASSQIGTSIAKGYSAGLGTDPGDLDGDGKPELCVGERISSLTGSSPGQAFLWYSDVVQTATVSEPLSYTDASPIAPPASADTARRVVEYAGDLNGDGAPDLVVGNPAGNSNQGAVTVLY